MGDTEQEKQGYGLGNTGNTEQKTRGIQSRKHGGYRAGNKGGDRTGNMGDTEWGTQGIQSRKNGEYRAGITGDTEQETWGYRAGNTRYTEQETRGIQRGKHGQKLSKTVKNGPFLTVFDVF